MLRPRPTLLLETRQGTQGGAQQVLVLRNRCPGEHPSGRELAEVIDRQCLDGETACKGTPIRQTARYRHLLEGILDCESLASLAVLQRQHKPHDRGQHEDRNHPKTFHGNAPSLGVWLHGNYTLHESKIRAMGSMVLRGRPRRIPSRRYNAHARRMAVSAC